MGYELDSTSELSLEVVKKRAVKGVLTLTGRTLILRLVAFVAQGLLWAFLDPVHFGTFLLVSAVVNFLSYFADIGLGAALIQKKDKPNNEDFKTVFTVQEILVISVSILLILASPLLKRTYSLSNEGTLLLYALTAAFFLASLKNIPSIILERRLEFGKFIVPQILEDLVYNVSVVFFAWKGFGIMSFTYSVLIRGVVGVIAIYILQPWKPGIFISKKSLKNLLAFGIPYQLNNFLATLKDDGLTILLGGVLGQFGLGILGTAQKASQYPLRFFMDNVTKVTFPAFSRMQDDKEQLSRLLGRSIFFICSLVFPSLIGLLILFPIVLVMIPRYQKWEPAYIPLIFFSMNSLIGSFTTQFTNTLNAVGKIKTTFKLMIMWTSLSWILIPYFSHRFGVNGAALAYFIVSASSVVVYFIIRRIIYFDAIYAIAKPFAASVFMGITLWILKILILKYTLTNFLILVIIGGLVYFLTLYFLTGKTLLSDVKKTFSSILSR